MKYIINRKAPDRAVPREAGWAIDAEKIAAIPLDTSLLDASELHMELVNSATIAEYMQIAEFCSGAKIVRKRSSFHWRSNCSICLVVNPRSTIRVVSKPASISAKNPSCCSLDSKGKTTRAS